MTSAERTGRKKLSHVLGFDSWLLIIIVGAVALRLHNLSAASLWLDEAQSVYDARSLGSIFQKFFHPPLYFLSLSFWQSLFGDSPDYDRLIWIVRGLSVAFDTLSLLMIYFIAKFLFQSSFAARVAALAYAVSPIAFLYARETRMYSLRTLLVLLTFYCLLRATECNSSRRWTAGYVVFATLGFFTHYFNAFYLIAFAIAAYFLLENQPARAKRWLQLHAPFLITGGLFLVFVWNKFSQSNLTNTAAYFTRFGLQSVNYETRIERLGDRLQGVFFEQFSFGSTSDAWTAALATAIIFFSSFHQMGRYFRGRPRYFLGILTAFLLVFLLINVLPFRNGASRYSIPSYALFSLAIGYLMYRLRTAGALALVLFAFSVYSSRRGDRLWNAKGEDWRKACEVVERNETDNDLVIINEAYMAVPFKLCYRGSAEVIGYPKRKQKIIGTPREAEGKETVWLLYSDHWHTDPQLKIAMNVNRKLRHVQSIEVSKAPGQIILFRFSNDPLSELAMDTDF